ncbi:Coq4 family protein [Sphingomonas bacterium]|uniref:Coq4 family protein n=1 Tax=Sphingomonas bacterium TaxID=1895847 RepID=UPI00157666BC|nr:Coq4 family protein [Sphingomonas bacterium]
MAGKVSPYRKDWRGAFAALRALLADGDDTHQVFLIMRALNGSATLKGYHRLLGRPGGGRIAYRRVELAERLSDPAYVAGFPPGSVGAAYRDWLAETGYSAAGLAAISLVGVERLAEEHPYAWFGRRTRDLHDSWHVLTGYKADETLGEAALVGFSYAQTGGLGWAWIAAGAALKSRRVTGGWLFARAVWEGYRNGRRAAWLQGEDHETLLHEPLDAARARLNIREPVAYRRAQAALGPAMASYASVARTAAA